MKISMGSKKTKVMFRATINGTIRDLPVSESTDKKYPDLKSDMALDLLYQELNMLARAYNAEIEVELT